MVIERGPPASPSSTSPILSRAGRLPPRIMHRTAQQGGRPGVGTRPSDGAFGPRQSIPSASAIGWSWGCTTYSKMMICSLLLLRHHFDPASIPTCDIYRQAPSSSRHTDHHGTSLGAFDGFLDAGSAARQPRRPGSFVVVGRPRLSEPAVVGVGTD